VGGNDLRIKLDDEDAISIAIAEVENVWRNSLSRKLEAEVMAAGKE